MFTSLSDTNYWRGEDKECKLFGTQCKGREVLEKDTIRSKEEDEIIIKTKIFDSRINDYVYIENTKTILINSNNQIWKSADQGYSWELIKELKDVISMIQNPYFKDNVDVGIYFITQSETQYYTTNAGKDIKSMSVPKKPNLLELPILDFHPTEKAWLIYTSSEECEDEFSLNCKALAHYTQDHGEKWKPLDEYVRICSWALDTKFIADKNLIFCESYEFKEGSQRSFINNPLQFWSSNNFGKNKTIIFNDIVGFATFDQYMVVAEILQYAQGLRLSVSLNGENFTEAKFPLSMQIIKNFANRDEKGFVDFEKIRGIDGIAIANIVSNVDELNMGGTRKKLISRITFNDGSTWKPLTIPERDSDHKPYYCKGDCSLHLHGYTERRNHRDAFSSSSAVGLVMGVGNVGNYLTPYSDGDTFLTRDAGKTWIEVRKGAHLYEFGDQGSILVMVDDEEPTDRFLYSFNEGGSWQEYDLTQSKERVKVYDITAYPSDVSSKFLLRGSYESNWSKEVIKYYRKFSDRICHIDKVKQPKVEDDMCSCTIQDYECDYNYIRKGESCELAPNVNLEYSRKEQCANGETYWYHSSGYRKIPISNCSSGRDFAEIEQQYCPRASSLFWGLFVLSSLIIIGIFGAYVMYRKRNRHSGYSTLGILSAAVALISSIRVPSFISQIFSRTPSPSSRSRYRYSPLTQEDSQFEVSLDDYNNNGE
ncbi:12256_t:CDS:10 [Gigaspora margarita]|uniref:12256_t:CDS:1 n=1 Tax=Gigaspora margarita TaxID=4874 RepID=A0ABM8W3V3_GIGMA|nr:12256_t:CDS:10 [Gigaspora margarita]